VFVLWGVFVGCLDFTDNSFITHLATGRLILDGSFPRHDVYSFTALGEPWVIQSWLASVVYAALERIGDSNTIHVLTAALCGATAGCVWLLTRPARGLVVRVGVAGLSVAVGSFAWSERPLMFGLLGLCIVLLVLEERIPVWVVLPVMWLWANSHGSFPLALVACLAVAAGRRLDGEHPAHELRVAAYVAVGTLLAVIGPLGLQILIFPFHLLGRSEVLQHIIEWQSPSFDGMWARLFLLQVCLAVVGLARRSSYRTAIPLVVFVALSLLSARNVAVAAIVMTPGMARSFSGIGSLTGDRPLRFGWVVAALIMVVAGAQMVSVLEDDGWDYSLYPVQGLAWAEDTGLLSSDQRLLAPDYVGNFLEGTRGTEANVFIDDRYDMYPDAVVDDYVAVVGGNERWREVLESWDITRVVWHGDEPLAQLLRDDPNWHVAWQDGDWVFFCQRGSAGCSRAPGA
jgi:hypothetical protein